MDEGQQRGEIRTAGKPADKVMVGGSDLYPPKSLDEIGVTKQRVAEARLVEPDHRGRQLLSVIVADNPIRRFHRQLADLRETGGRTPCEGRLDDYFATSRIVQAEAAEACLSCVLIDACFEAAVAEEAGEPIEGVDGVRGGTTSAERRRMRRDTARETA